MTNILTLNIKSKIVSLQHPKLMGILNYTEDSFFDGGTIKSLDDLYYKIEEMIINDSK
jgi:dihydropteroate synthase